MRSRRTRGQTARQRSQQRGPDTARRAYHPPSSRPGTRMPRSPIKSAPSCSAAARHGAGCLALGWPFSWSWCCCCHHLSVRRRRRHLGHQHPGGVGICHCQFRLVDWHWACRHADFGHSLAHAPAVAHLDQPLCRGHDAICRGLCRAVPTAAPGAPVVFLLAVSVSQHDGYVAPVSQSAGLGLLCRLYLWHRLAALLVHWPDSGPGHAARPLAKPCGPCHLRHAGHGLARLRRATGIATRWHTCSWRGWPRRWWFQCIALSASILPSRILPGWHSTIFPPYFVAGAIFSGFAMVLTIAIPVRRHLSPGRLHYHAAPAGTWR